MLPAVGLTRPRQQCTLAVTLADTVRLEYKKLEKEGKLHTVIVSLKNTKDKTVQAVRKMAQAYLADDGAGTSARQRLIAAMTPETYKKDDLLLLLDAAGASFFVQEGKNRPTKVQILAKIVKVSKFDFDKLCADYDAIATTAFEASTMAAAHVQMKYRLTPPILSQGLMCSDKNVTRDHMRITRHVMGCYFQEVLGVNMGRRIAMTPHSLMEAFVMAKAKLKEATATSSDDSQGNKDVNLPKLTHEINPKSAEPLQAGNHKHVMRVGRMAKKSHRGGEDCNRMAKLSHRLQRGQDGEKES